MRLGIVGTIVAATAVVLPFSGGGTFADCTAAEQSTIGCPVNDGTEIIVDGDRTDPGSPGTSPIGNDSPGPGIDAPWHPPPEFDFGQCVYNWDSYIGCFRAIEDDEEADDEEPTAPMPPITISDLARFAPEGSALAGEPGNVGVAGLPTNFVTSASVHTINDTLFGFPIAVRFTPAGYDFTFGDGTTMSSATGGHSWSELGQAQFTPTETSHVYRERGTYLAHVDVRYSAEIDLGIGWFPITGAVTASGPVQEIRIFEAHTALVAHTCEQAPSSPGC